MGGTRKPLKYAFPERNQIEHQSAVAGWLGEPGTERRERLRKACQEGRPSVEEALAPLEWFIGPYPSATLRNALADELDLPGTTDAETLTVVADLRGGRPVGQVMLAVFLSGVFEFAWRTPHGLFDPGRFITNAVGAAIVTHSQAAGLDQSRMDAIATEIRARIEWVKNHLRQTAVALHDDGWRIDPAHEPNLVILGELILCEVDWSLPAGQLAGMLTTTGLVGFSMDFRGTEASDHASAELERDASVYRRAQRTESGHSHIAQPYAGGGTRKSGPRGLAGRLRALWPEFRRAFPSASYCVTFNTWDHSDDRPGGWLGKRTGLARPSQDLLRRLFKDFDNTDDV